MIIYVLSMDNYANTYYSSAESAIKGLFYLQRTEKDREKLIAIKNELIANLTKNGAVRIGTTTIHKETVID